MICGNGTQTGAGAWVVLIFWPNFRLAVLIEVVLIKKKACILRLYDHMGMSLMIDIGAHDC